MANFESVLAGIPGYGGYLAKERYNRQNEAGDVQQVAALSSLLGGIQQQKMQQEKIAQTAKLKDVLAGLTPEQTADPRYMKSLFLQHANPHDALMALSKNPMEGLPDIVKTASLAEQYRGAGNTKMADLLDAKLKKDTSTETSSGQEQDAHLLKVKMALERGEQVAPEDMAKAQLIYYNKTAPRLDPATGQIATPNIPGFDPSRIAPRQPMPAPQISGVPRSSAGNQYAAMREQVNAPLAPTMETPGNANDLADIDRQLSDPRTTSAKRAALEDAKAVINADMARNPGKLNISGIPESRMSVSAPTKDNYTDVHYDEKQGKWFGLSKKLGRVVEVPGDMKPSPKLKDIPQSTLNGMMENNRSLVKIDEALNAIQGKQDALPQGVKADKAATGFKGYLPNAILSRVDPQGVDARALIADIGSLKIHDRSGPAVTASESPRLMPFIPLATDEPATVVKKLNNFKREYSLMQQEANDYYNEANGFKPYKPASGTRAPGRNVMDEADAILKGG